jgi:hypothetical protein
MGGAAIRGDRYVQCRLDCGTLYAPPPQRAGRVSQDRDPLPKSRGCLIEGWQVCLDRRVSLHYKQLTRRLLLFCKNSVLVKVR